MIADADAKTAGRFAAKRKRPGRLGGRPTTTASVLWKRGSIRILAGSNPCRSAACGRPATVISPVRSSVATAVFTPSTWASLCTSWDGCTSRWRPPEMKTCVPIDGRDLTCQPCLRPVHEADNQHQRCHADRHARKPDAGDEQGQSPADPRDQEAGDQKSLVAVEQTRPLVPLVGREDTPHLLPSLASAACVRQPRFAPINRQC